MLLLSIIKNINFTIHKKRKIMKKYYLFIALCLLITSCATEKSVQTDATPIYLQEMTKVKTIPFGDERFFRKCSVINLELSEESIIGKISQIEFFNNYIYILDQKTNTLKVFDMLGNYVQSIGKRGNGPGEFLAINTFYINEQNRTINLFDPLKQAVMRYDLFGKYIESIKFPDPVLGLISRATCFGKDKVFCFTNPNWLVNSGYFIIDENDYTIIEKIYQYPFEMEKQMAFMLMTHPYSMYNDDLLFVSLFSNTITLYANGEKEPLFQVENKLLPADNEYVKKLAKENDEDYLKIIRKMLDDKKYTVGLKNIFETEQYICVDFYGKNLLSEAILWDKKANLGYHIEDYYTNSSADFGSIVTCFDNTLVKILKDNDISYLKEQMENNENKTKYPDEILNSIEKHEDGDNPILLLYEFK